MVDVSICLDILTFEFWAILEHPPTLPGCMQTRHQLLDLHNLAILRLHPWFSQRSFVTQTILAQWILQKSLSRLLQSLFEVQLVPETSVTLAPAQRFGDERYPSMKQSELLCLLFLASSISCFLLLTLVSCQAEIFSSFFYIYFVFTAAFGSGFFIALGMGMKLLYKNVVVQALWSSWSLGQDPSNRALLDSSALTMHASFVLGKSRRATSYPVLAFTDLAWHGRFHWNLQLSARVPQGFCKLFLLCINEADSSQSSGIVKPWFLNSPLLFFSSLRSIRHMCILQEVFRSIW